MTERFYYRSFEEIETRLKELKLSRDVAKEKLMLDFNNMRAGCTWKNKLLGRAVVLKGNAWKNMALTFAIKRVLGVLKKGRRLLSKGR